MKELSRFYWLSCTFQALRRFQVALKFFWKTLKEGRRKRVKILNIMHYFYAFSLLYWYLSYHVQGVVLDTGNNWPYFCHFPKKMMCWLFYHLTTEIPLLDTFQYRFKTLRIPRFWCFPPHGNHLAYKCYTIRARSLFTAKDAGYLPCLRMFCVCLCEVRYVYSVSDISLKRW